MVTSQRSEMGREAFLVDRWWFVSLNAVDSSFALLQRLASKITSTQEPLSKRDGSWADDEWEQRRHVDIMSL